MIHTCTNGVIITDTPKHSLDDIFADLWDAIKDVKDSFFPDAPPVKDKDCMQKILTSVVEDICFIYSVRGEFIGCLYLVCIAPGLKATMHGFAGGKYRTPKISNEVVRFVVDHFIDKYSLKRLESVVPKNNRPSKLLLLRSGFQCEGLLRNFDQHQGKPVDYWVLSTLGE